MANWGGGICHRRRSSKVKQKRRFVQGSVVGPSDPSMPPVEMTISYTRAKEHAVGEEMASTPVDRYSVVRLPSPNTTVSVSMRSDQPSATTGRPPCLRHAASITWSGKSSATLSFNGRERLARSAVRSPADRPWGQRAHARCMVPLSRRGRRPGISGSSLTISGFSLSASDGSIPVSCSHGMMEMALRHSENVG